MDREKGKYNYTKARYIAMLILQNRYNRNRGISYSQAVKENYHIKAGIDYWLDLMEKRRLKNEN